MRPLGCDQPEIFTQGYYSCIDHLAITWHLVAESRYPGKNKH